MTAVLWVRRTQLRLGLLASLRVLGFSACVWYGITAAGAELGAETGLAALIASLITCAVILWRERFLWSIPRVALWLEERIPQLRYALVTAVDPQYATALDPNIKQLLEQVDPTVAFRKALVRTLLPILALVAVLIAFTRLLPGWASAPEPSTGHSSFVATASKSRLAPIVATVTPPPYAVSVGMPTQTIEDPATIEGLAGSEVEISGAGSPDGITAQLGESNLSVGAAASARWRMRFVMPDTAEMLKLTDRADQRFVVIGPQRDRAPVAQLVLPARDTAMRVVTGRIALDARLTDDIGVSAARFEYIVSSGDTEGSFTAREATLGARRFDASSLKRTNEGQTRRLRMEVPLSYFGLNPGDQLSIRAVVTDNNTRNGPATGYSESRTIRITHPSEYDSLAVEAAPPPADSALMTLRYLIQLSERLEAGRKALPRPLFVDSSRGLGARAFRLRFRVQQLQDDHTLGGMFPRNPLLTTAYMALAEGEGALKVAEPGAAVPHLWEALRALQQVAMAERYYLRGRGGDVLVDLARVRLTGTAEATTTSRRRPRSPADTTRARMQRDFTTALGYRTEQPERTRRLLMQLQVEAMRSYPALATVLGDAISELREKGNPAVALERGRRLLEGQAVSLDSLPNWSGAW